MTDTETPQKKIPYGSNILINCPNCGFNGEPEKYRNGNNWIEAISWLFIIPGAIYTAWRHINTICICPKCGETYLEETDGDTNLVTSLMQIKKKQIIRFWIIVITCSILGGISYYRTHYVNTPYVHSHTNTRTIKTSTTNTNNSTKKNNNTTKDLFDTLSKPINNLTDEEKYQNYLNDVAKSVAPKQEVKEDIVPEAKEELQEEPKDEKDEIREKVQNVLKQIDNQYSNTDGYIGASCLGDCLNGTINVDFSKDIGWYDFTVRAHAAMLSNKIIRAVPNYFDQIRVSFNYNGQTVCSCIFTEYQQNTMAPKGCTYFGYNN